MRYKYFIFIKGCQFTDYNLFSYPNINFGPYPSTGHWMKYRYMYIINRWINIQLWMPIDDTFFTSFYIILMLYVFSHFAIFQLLYRMRKSLKMTIVVYLLFYFWLIMRCNNKLLIMSAHQKRALAHILCSLGSIKKEVETIWNRIHISRDDSKRLLNSKKHRRGKTSGMETCIIFMERY